ncbi:response regulator [Carboxylicivirga taeanensis]|uniref:response regulator n=1 Tax=Carboxylicivirga taeanensis TaxID=1416875 RepID=UPI003F6DE844
MHKVLVIDDSEVSLFLIKAIFSDDNTIEILTEKDSVNAVDTIRKEKPDIIILDLMMPVINGFDLLEKIKSDSAIKQIPIIVITASQDEDSYNRAMEYGVNEYFTKPIEMKNIVNCIKRMVAS